MTLFHLMCFKLLSFLCNTINEDICDFVVIIVDTAEIETQHNSQKINSMCVNLNSNNKKRNESLII